MDLDWVIRCLTLGDGVVPAGTFLDSVLSHGLYPGVVLILVICGLGLPLSEELVFLTAGWYGQKHGANIWLLCASGVIGILLGDSIPYWAGRKFGVAVLKRRPFSWVLSAKGIEKTRAFFGKHGARAVFCGRFVAGLRMPTFFMAGSMGVTYPSFIVWDLLGALISCPVSVWLAYTFGSRAEEMLKESKPFLIGFLVLVVSYTIYHVWSHREKPDPDEKKAPDAAPASPPPVIPRNASTEPRA